MNIYFRVERLRAIIRVELKSARGIRCVHQPKSETIAFQVRRRCKIKFRLFGCRIGTRLHLERGHVELTWRSRSSCVHNKMSSSHVVDFLAIHRTEYQ